MEGSLPLMIFFLVWLGKLFIPTIPMAAAAKADYSPPATALFVLGDSSVNCGDNTFFYPLLPPNFSSPLCLGPHHRLLPDLIAERMGLPPVPRFYRGNWTAEELMGGVNFGSTPATIVSAAAGGGGGGGGRYAYDLLPFQSLSQQVRQVCETLQLLHLELGPTAAGHVASSSLFLLSFGQDDYIGLFSSSTVVPKYGRRGLARILVSQMVRAVKELYNADVRRIACMGVRPLGCAPRILWEGIRSDRPVQEDCVEEVNEVVSSYNTKLSARLLKLNSELPDAQIVFCDLYRGVMEIISNPLSYGFENVRDACCGAGRFRGMIGCLTEEMACGEPSSHVWWDPYSTTEAVNTLLANWSWSSSVAQFHICNPINLHQMAPSQ